MPDLTVFPPTRNNDEPPTTTINGTALPGALIQVMPPDPPLTTTADERGDWTIDRVPESAYPTTVKSTHNGNIESVVVTLPEK